MTRMVNCVKLGREAEGLAFQPVPGDLGKKIFENVSKEAWGGWQRASIEAAATHAANRDEREVRRTITVSAPG